MTTWPPPIVVEYLDPFLREHVAIHGGNLGVATAPRYTFGRAHPTDAGHDLAVAFDDHVVIQPGASETIRCGIKLAMPPGMFGLILPRSGFGFKQDGATHEGTIDEGFRGPIQGRARNFGSKAIVLRRGERFAQLILLRYETPIVVEGTVEEDTPRGAAGYGSTGP